MVVAAFDFDGTITTKDTLFEFIKFSKGKFRLYTGVLLHSPLFLISVLGIFPKWQAKEIFFSYFFKNTNIKQFDEWGEKFVLVVEEMLNPHALSAIKKHQQNNDTLVVISASVENWIKPWCQKQGINAVLATQIEINPAGELTGKFHSKNCYGKEKVCRLLQVFPGKENYTLVAYGDSKGDKELLAFADIALYRKYVY